MITETQNMSRFYQGCLQWRPPLYSSEETRSAQCNTETHNPVKETNFITSGLRERQNVKVRYLHSTNTLNHQNICRRRETTELFSQRRRCGVQTRLRPALLTNVHQIHPRTFMWRETHVIRQCEIQERSFLIIHTLMLQLKLLHLITVLYSQLIRLGQYSTGESSVSYL